MLENAFHSALLNFYANFVIKSLCAWKKYLNLQNLPKRMYKHVYVIPS